MAERMFEYVCEGCGCSEWMQRWRHSQKKHPDLCKGCSIKKGREQYKKIRKNNSEQWKAITQAKVDAAKRKHSVLSSAERTKQAKYRKSCTTTEGRKRGRIKQQETITSDPEKYRKYCEKRKKIAQQFHDNMTEEQKERHYRKVLKNNGRSKECDDFMQTLQENKIICDTEQYVHGFIVDGIIQDTNIIIEYYGDMFHCNPRKFTNPNQVCSWLGGRTVQEQWNRDKQRLAALYKYEYKVIIVWGVDWKDDPSAVIGRIKNEMCKC